MAESVTRISSLSNTRIKDIVRLKNRRQRDEKKLTVVEGLREAERALRAGVVPSDVYICPDLIDEADDVIISLRRLGQTQAVRIFEVTPAVFEKMAYRGESGGLLLVIPYLDYTLDQLLVSRTPFLVIIDGAEKPGNLGAILRTADAAGVDGIILTNDDVLGTDVHNPNVVRASLGALFSVPVVSTPAQEALSWLQDHQIYIVATSPDASEIYTAVPLTGPIAVVLGSEAFGLSDKWLRAANRQVRIPMFGVIDSLNLSVSTALLLYEVVRQRSAAGNARQLPLS